MHICPSYNLNNLSSVSRIKGKVHTGHIRCGLHECTRCNEDSSNALKQYSNRELYVEHSNENETILFLRSTNYSLCIAWQWILSTNRSEENVAQKLNFLSCTSLLVKREIKKLLYNLFYLVQHMKSCLALAQKYRFLMICGSHTRTPTLGGRRGKKELISFHSSYLVKGHFTAFQTGLLRKILTSTWTCCTCETSILNIVILEASLKAKI